MARWKRRLWKWIAGAFAALVILLATLAGLLRLVTPLVPSYRAQVEQWASATLNHPVVIHSMSTDWSWHGPEVALQDVRILSDDRRSAAVTAEEVRFGLNLRALLHFNLPRPDRVVLVAPHLEVERAADGNYAIRGLAAGRQGGPLNWHDLMQQAFAQSAEIVVKNGRLTLYDARLPRAAEFQRIALTVDNSPADHHLHGELAPPAEFGQALKFDVRIHGEDLEPAHWAWQGRLRGEAVQFPRWLDYWPGQERFLTSGGGDFDIEIDGNPGELQRLYGNLDLRGIKPSAADAGLQSVQGKFTWTRTADGWQLQGRRVTLQRVGGSPWPRTDLDLAYGRDADGEHWSGNAGFLRLEDVMVPSTWAPVDALPSQAQDVLGRLHAFAPAGEIAGLVFKLRWDGKAVRDWSVRSTFQDLGLHATGGWPGFSGLDGDVELAESGGKVRLRSRDAEVDFRPLFRWPLHADSADLAATVTHDAQGWRVAADSFKVGNADGAGHGRVAMQFPADGGAPRLDLDAVVERGDARNKSAYFPVGIMPKPVVEWLDSAIKAGQVDSGTVAIHGKTSDFPYYDGKGGTFDIRFHVKHAELDYAPDWPALKDVDADVRFLDQGLSAKANSGTIQGLAIEGGQAGFADLSTGVLEVQGNAHGSAGNGLDFLRQGPLKEILAGYLDGISAKGETNVSVQFTLPVTHVEDFKLDGKAVLHQASAWVTVLPALDAEHLEGSIAFGNYGLATENLRGTLLGGPMSVSIKVPGKRGPSILAAHGSASAAGLAALLGYGSERWLEGAAGWQLDGKLPLQAGVGIRALNLSVRSDLKGLAVKLPDPFGKRAEDSLPMQVTMRFQNENDLSFNGRYGSVLGLRLDYVPGHGGLAFGNGALRVGGGAAAPSPAAGFTVSGYLPTLNWDEWKPLMPPAPPGEGGAAAPARANVPKMLRSVDLRIGRVMVLGQDLDDMHLALNRSDAGWQGRVDNTNLTGTFSVPAEPDAEHPIVLEMDRVNLGKPAAASSGQATGEAKSEPQFDPRSIPALRFSSKHLQYDNMVLDNVSLSLVPRPDGTALRDLKVAAPTFGISGDGTWLVMPGGQQRTTLNADVESSDVEKSLQALGYDAGVTGDHGSIVASLNWAGSPLGDAVKTLGGTIHMKLQDGQLKEVQPGAGRLFGLLSLNALPRRLLLNFSDVFAKGFGYDSIEGDFTLQDGDAYTQDLQMKGPAASIHLIGRIGLAKRDFDEALVVDASVGSTLPVVGALAGGVGVGAVVFLLTEIFKKPLTQAGEVRYHLTGTWDNPTLTKVASAPPAAATRNPE